MLFWPEQRCKINCLSIVCRRASTKLQEANGIFISKLCYLIQLLGGCADYLLHALQILQNRAVRTQHYLN